MRRLVAVVLLVGLVGCGPAASTGPSPAALKKTQKYQRYLYDKWTSCLRTQQLATDPQEAQKQAKEAEDAVGESWTRYSKHPSAFKDLPAFDSEYFRGTSINGYDGP
jgi:hypothetical protein